jgi:hypothetical protein
MAWPIDARYRSFTANVTTITAASLNAIQDAIYGVVGGSKSVLQLLVDGTGDQSVSLSGLIAQFTGGTVQFDGGSLDSSAAILAAKVPSNFKLWAKFAPTGFTQAVRIYYSPTATVLYVTVNAGWNGSNWVTDSGSACARYVFDYSGMTVQGHATGTFADGSWTTGYARPGRLDGSGTAVVTGDFGSLTGWGSGATVSAVTGTDLAGTVTITAGTGTGSANSLTYTFHDGGWTNPPRILWHLVTTDDTAFAPTAMVPLMKWAENQTNTVLTGNFTAVNTKVYTFGWMMVGQKG